MKHSDFQIGLEFLAAAGFRWRCTDVGTRTIVAIRVDHENPDWYQGPPYIAQEVVFDEAEISQCHRTIDEAIEVAVHEHETSGHPGYPADVVDRMMEARHAHRYPHDGLLRFDRRRPDGEILHPYAGHKEGNNWVVELYLPFCQTFETMAEDAFIALQRATAQDVRRRAARVDRAAAMPDNKKNARRERFLRELVREVEDMIPEGKAPEFDASEWVRAWVETPQPALGGRAPAAYFETAAGRKIVRRLLGSMGSGAYQ